MAKIRQLSASIINKIAAGEVIERPASVVKELLENSIDAGATRIELAIEGGGLELIRISDNGCGIDADDLPLAIASHATSKLQSADDLFDVHSLGFRGEALASIAEVSHMVLRSRVATESAGAEIQVRGGQSDPIVPAGTAVGTVIEIRHLFFNTPVRRKFLRAPQTESSHVVEAFTRIALAYPQVHMVMQSGSRQLFDLPPTENLIQRIAKFFGNEIADALLSVQSEHEGIRLHGFVTDPSVSRSNNRMQYLFLNGRHIRDRSLQHALSEAYRGLLMVGRFPVCFLQLEIPPQLVDVNVHPTKMEVRFQESGKVYSQLLQTLRHRFLSTDLTARVRSGSLQAIDATYSADDPTSDSRSIPFSPALGFSPGNASRWDAHADRISAGTSTGTNLETQRLPFPNAVPEFQRFPPLGGHLNIQSIKSGAPGGSGESISAPHPSLETAEPAMAEPRIDRNDRVHATQSSACHSGYQIHNRYLVTQDDQGMVVVDQHALHERILYEQLRRKIDQGKLESQQLLVPEPMDLTPAEAAAALDSRELLAKIGINVEPFGGDTILMTSYPAMLANMRPSEMLRQVLQPLMEGGKEPSARDLLDDLLNMIACKAAVKAGDHLSPEEITSLLEQRYHYQDTHHCPHGRPTALFFSRDQLDKMFKRT